MAVATDLTWRLTARNDALSCLLGFRPTTLWQHRADTTATENFGCDVGLDGLSP